MAKFETITEAEFAATAAAKPRRKSATLYATDVRYDAKTRAIDIRLNNGVVGSIPVDLIPALAKANPTDLEDLVVEGLGYGLHVPALDLDLSIPALFEDALGATTMKRAQSRATASRQNGKLGGRPRKPAAA